MSVGRSLGSKRGRDAFVLLELATTETSLTGLVNVFLTLKRTEEYKPYIKV